MNLTRIFFFSFLYFFLRLHVLSLNSSESSWKSKSIHILFCWIASSNSKTLSRIRETEMAILSSFSANCIVRLVRMSKSCFNNSKPLSRPLTWTKKVAEANRVVFCMLISNHVLVTFNTFELNLKFCLFEWFPAIKKKKEKRKKEHMHNQ